MNNFKSSFTIPSRAVYRVFTLLINILTINRNYFKSIDSVYFLFQNSYSLSLLKIYTCEWNMSINIDIYMYIHVFIPINTCICTL